MKRIHFKISQNNKILNDDIFLDANSDWEYKAKKLQARRWRAIKQSSYNRKQLMRHG